LATNLVGTAAFAPGMGQLDPIGVDDTQHRWGGQEELRPVLLGREEAKEARALREAGEEGAIIARQPARERQVAHACEGIQQPQSDDLPGSEVGRGVWG
jgi:hypothetical protein